MSQKKKLDGIYNENLKLHERLQKISSRSSNISRLTQAQEDWRLAEIERAKLKAIEKDRLKKLQELVS